MCYARLSMPFWGLCCVAGMPPSTLWLQVFNAYRVQHNDFRGELDLTVSSCRPSHLLCKH